MTNLCKWFASGFYMQVFMCYYSNGGPCSREGETETGARGEAEEGGAGETDEAPAGGGREEGTGGGGEEKTN